MVLFDQNLPKKIEWLCVIDLLLEFYRFKIHGVITLDNSFKAKL